MPDKREKKFRQVPGLHSAMEVFNTNPSAIAEVWLEQGYERNQDLREIEALAKKNRIPVKLKPAAQLRQLTEHHQGVCVLTSYTPELS